jgi:retinol-binding protein 3
MRSLVVVLVVASVSFSMSQPALAAGQAAPSTPAASTAAPAPGLDAAARKRVIHAAIARMTEGYVFPNKVPAIAKALNAGLAGRYRAISDPKAFADAVNADMEAVANDRHLRLIWSADPLPPPPDPDKMDPAMREKFHEFMAQHNYAIRQAQILDGNIGYLKINGFLPAEDAGPTLAAAMGFLKNSDALIIDLRDNGGGDPEDVAMLVSYLEPAETLINTFHQRDKAVNDQIWTAPYVAGGRWSTDKPVYVLTSKNTASGAEEFAYDMQQLKRGTVVGSSTWGGANPGKIEPIDDHFAIFVPFGMAVNPISKTNWEGVGVKPDIAVAPAEALETAKHLALQKLLEGATGDRRAELQDLIEGKPPRSPH